MKEAEIERCTYTQAICPACDEEHDIDDFGHGEIDCDCGETFHWNSEI